MRSHRDGISRLWVFLGLAVIVIAIHMVPLYYLTAHKLVSTSLVLSILGLIILKHLGLFGPLYAAFRRRSRKLRYIQFLKGQIRSLNTNGGGRDCQYNGANGPGSFHPKTSTDRVRAEVYRAEVGV